MYDGVETWLKPLKNDEWAVVFLNRSKTVKTISQDWKSFLVIDDFSGRKLDITGKNVFELSDLLLKNQVGDTRKTLTATIPAHDVLCLKISKKTIKSRK